MRERGHQKVWQGIIDIPDGSSQEHEEVRKRRLATLISIVIVPFLILFAIRDMAIGHHAIAIYCGFFALVILSSAICIQLPNTKFRLVWLFRTGISFSLLLFLYFVFESSQRPQYLFWTYVFPLVVFFLLGKREGLLWVASLVILSALIMFLSITPNSQTVNFKIRFIGSLFIVSSITYAYEAIRERSQHTIHTQYMSLHQTQEEYRRANQVKNVFLSNMSHEFRTPLNHVIGFSELMLNGSMGLLNREQEENLQNILKSSRQLLVIINDILDYTNVETGKLQYQPETVAIRTLLENSVSPIREIAVHHNIKVILDTDGIPENILADRQLLKQIMYNLLSNAMKFTPDNGTITVQAFPVQNTGLKNPPESGGKLNAASESTEDCIILQIVVQDTGSGIRKDLENTIFMPFEKGEDYKNKKHPGIGLGLALSTKLAELHGGTIQVQSDGEGKGSMFKFTFPCYVRETT